MPKAAITRIPNLEIFQQNNNKTTGLFLQALTQAQVTNAISRAPATDSMLVSNVTTNTVQILQPPVGNAAAVVSNITTTPVTAGVGFTVGTTATIINGGPATANGNTGVQQLAGNQVGGFLYFNTTANTLKYFNGTNWFTISSVQDA